MGALRADRSEAPRATQKAATKAQSFSPRLSKASRLRVNQGSATRGTPQGTKNRFALLLPNREFLPRDRVISIKLSTPRPRTEFPSDSAAFSESFVTCMNRAHVTNLLS